MSVIITTDSTCDLNQLSAERNVPIVPLSVELGENTYLDGINIQPEMIFNYVAETKQLPKTSAPNVEDYLNCFQKYVGEGHEIVHISLSSGISNSNRAANLAAQEVGAEKVFVVDSLALSSAQGLLVMKACDLRDEGKSAREIYEAVLALVPKTQTSFVVDRLDYLHKGGRCSLLSLYSAKALKIRPSIHMDEGKLKVKKRMMGPLKHCIKKYIESLAEEFPKYDKTRCFITHTLCTPEVVQVAKDAVKKYFDFDEILETNAGSVITSHCGQGTLGLLFLSEESVKNAKKKKKEKEDEE